MKLLALVLLFVTGISAQTSERQLNQIRDRLGLPDGALIRLNEDLKLNRIGEVNTLISVDRSTNEKRLIRWTEKWNKKNSAKQGVEISLTSTVDNASVAVVQLIDKRVRIEQERFVRVGNVDANTGRPGDLEVDSGINNRVLRLPVYSYILLKIDGVWTIVFSAAETSVTGEERINPDSKIRGALNRFFKRQ